MSLQQRKLLWPAITVALTFTALIWVSASTKTEATSAHVSPDTPAPASPVVAEKPSPDSLPQESSAKERTETELITIQPGGFEPAEITRPQGRVFLEVDNRSGLSEINLRLDAEHGNRLHQARVRREQLDWHQEIDLRPGRYLLTEANHPDWVGRITITAR